MSPAIIISFVVPKALSKFLLRESMKFASDMWEL